MIGSVYFIQEGPGGAIKIGWTAGDVGRRRDNLQTGNSKTLELLGHVAGVPQSVEAEWHMRFRDLHARAEWFLPARQLLSAIREEAVSPPAKRRRAYTTRGLSGPSIPLDRQVGVVLISEWMEREGLSLQELAQLTDYQPNYLEELISGRVPFGREAAKRFHALAGDDLHPLETLADKADNHHIKPFLARLAAKREQAA